MKKEKIIKNIILQFILLLSFMFVINCSKRQEIVKISGNTMGTTYNITVIENNKNDSNKLKKEIDDILLKVNMEMSTYIGESEISRFNELNSTDWFSVSRGFTNVVKNSLNISVSSKGAFDITIGPLIELWGFGKKSGEKIPSEEETDLTTQYIGYKKLDVNLLNSSIKKEESRLKINLAAIAKGYGVDKVAEFLNSKDFNSYLVEIGGEVRVKGKKFGKNWRIGIVTPDTVNDYNKIVLLSDTSLATSGDYFNYFEKDGKRYSHTIDPVTKKPITHKLASVTVVHELCMLADGFATAINVMGPEKGYSFAIKENLPIYMIIRKDGGFIIKMTPSFKKLLSE